MRAAIDDADDETLTRQVAACAAAREEARRARDLAVERATQARFALDALEQREGAAEAAQQEQDALAEITETMDRFTREHVAARLLSRAIERYREAHQHPIVTRASAAFRTLTNGRWEGIAVDYDADTPALPPPARGGSWVSRALRGDGRPVVPRPAGGGHRGACPPRHPPALPGR